jgi:hypothetical protein
MPRLLLKILRLSRRCFVPALRDNFYTETALPWCRQRLVGSEEMKDDMLGYYWD